MKAWNKRAGDSPFKVGDRVRNIHTGDTGVVTGAIWHAVRWDSGGVHPYNARALELVPELPDDHIDRFWVPGAWIQHSQSSYPVAVVNEAWGVKVLVPDLEPSATRKTEHVTTGWSFHPDSPIKEKREP